MKFSRNIIPALFILVAFSACKSYEYTNTGRNLSYLYRPGASSLHPRFLVYNKDDSLSVLMVKLFPKELLFKKKENGESKAWLSIRYKLRELEGNQVVDSLVKEYLLDPEQMKKAFVARLDIKAKEGKEYVLEIISIDRMRKRAVQSFVWIDRSLDRAHGDYYAIESGSRGLIFFPVLDSTRSFRLFGAREPLSEINVNYFKPDIRPPYPPSMQLSTPLDPGRPDSSWVEIVNTDMYMEKEGIYQYQASRDDKQGYYLYNFGMDFPLVKRADRMIEPLVYLATDREMDRMRNNPSAKLAVDEFWMGNGNDLNRSKELISVYYNRVFYANYYFSTFKEGWCTDRGMIYLVYGPPPILYKTPTREKWIYGKEGSDNSLEFVFKRIPHDLSDNVYRLNRGLITETRWDRAVRAWRQGKLYNIEND